MGTIYTVDYPLSDKDFVMLGDNIMVKRFKEKQVTDSGIIISVDEEKVVKRQEGVILAVGPGKMLDDGTTVPLKVKPGDVVWFGEWAGVEFKAPDGNGGHDQYLFMHEADVCAVVQDKKADA